LSGEKQLVLKLSMHKRPVRVLVIDHIEEKPSADDSTGPSARLRVAIGAGDRDNKGDGKTVAM
jgi:hypothetical protein